MPTVHQIASEIVGREGGYVNDPDDPGGATKYGVTIHTMRHLRIDLDNDGDVDIQDVKLLTIERATEIFVRHYFEKTGIAKLPEPLQASVFDMNVNAGSNSIVLLQNMLNSIRGLGDPIVVDGAIGPNTAARTAQAFKLLGEELVNAYGIERRNYYYRLADRRPSMRKYARRRNGGKGGWIRRAEEFLAPRYHLTEAQHRQRIAHW